MKHLFITLFLFVSSSALGHAYHFGMTEVGINTSNGSLEVVHSYFVRDFAMAINGGTDIAMDEGAVQTYINDHFVMFDPELGVLPLQWVGMDVDAESIMLFRELPNVELSSGSLVVKSTVLYEIEDSQTNTVNALSVDGRVTSYTFNSDEDMQVIDLN